MRVIRDAIVSTLRDKFPAHEKSIQPFIGLLDEDTDKQITYAAPGMLVCILPYGEAPENIAPWELQGNFAIVISRKELSALERDSKGWELCDAVAEVAYRNTWGISGLNIRPAVLMNIQKNNAFNPDGTPNGTSYWTIQFYNWLKFRALRP